MTTNKQLDVDKRIRDLQESIDRYTPTQYLDILQRVNNNIFKEFQMTERKVYNITPVPKPRMTGRDKWLHPPRPCVARYRAFKDEVHLNKIDIPFEWVHITFFIPIPKSWSNQRQQEMVWKPHQQTPDIDNLLKGLLDAIFDDDSRIWDIRATKLWAKEGAIELIYGKK